MSTSTIQQLLQSPAIWQASQKNRLKPSISTGYIELDQQLHYSGWPQSAISELLLSSHGIGEIRLLSPLLAQLSSKSGYIAWINPPYQPYAPGLTEQQVQLNKLLIIKPNSIQDSIWAAQQAMGSGACSAVLLWLPEKTRCTDIRKLNIAAKKGNCWGIILRPAQLQKQPSAAALRIIIQIHSQQAHLSQHQLSIIKQPGGWSGQQINLSLFPERIHWNALSAQHWPIYTPSPTITQKTNSLLLSAKHTHTKAAPQNNITTLLH